MEHKDNIITPPKGATFDDMKCQGEEYIPITADNCVVANIDQLKEKCANYQPVFAAICEVECCAMGNCDLDDEVETYSGKVEDEVYDDVFVGPSQCKDENQHNGLGGDLCPDVDADRIIEISHQSSEQMKPIIYDINFHTPHDSAHGRTVSFRVDPPENISKAYVRYEKKVGEFANDPACDKFEAAPGCTEDSANLVTVGCIEYPGVAPFAFFDVFFSSALITKDDTEIEKCCHPDALGVGEGVVKYSYKIQCGCPDTA